MMMYISGQEVRSVGGEWIDVRNPATGLTAGRVPAGTSEDTDRAVNAASQAFPAWAALQSRERGKILFRAAEVVRAGARDLAVMLTTEQGKPLREAKNEVLGFANILEYYASISGSIHGTALQHSPYGYPFVAKKPLGVCGAIIPWNMPVIIFGWKIGPALVAGNTIVVKPASTAPLTVLSISKIISDAGLPPGVLNIVTGRGSSAGEALAAHPTVRKLSFTGSVETGRRIAEISAPQFRRLTLELGGSDPMIVCADADIDKAVAGAIKGRFYNCGQTCTAVKRLYLDASIADEFIRRLKESVSQIRVGDGLLKGVQMGPVNTEEQRLRIDELIEEVRSSGQGKIICGGHVPAGDEYANGWFYEPTVITDLAEDSPLLQTEIFGPVLPVVVTESLDEAIERANRTPFGLGASVWTKDLSEATKAAEALEAGIIWVNQHLAIPPDVPFGGVKSSGIGRENGYESLDSYLETKTILVKP